ncbi:MAG TPA: hypothetical protein VK255_01420 [Patescibacteria group bacterium]|nr:hypothetical protein [Patescibacteria group bacterium]
MVKYTYLNPNDKFEIMSFDLTKEISLDKKNYSTYRRLQITFYALAMFFAFYVAYLVLFPTRYFSFSFPNPNSTQNTIINPRDIEGNFADRGRMNGKDGLLFDAASPGNFSQVEINITLDKKSEIPNEINLSARKSYQAFFYPKGDALENQTTSINPEIPDGSLVSYGKSVYLISGNFIYPIDSVETFNEAGFDWNDVIPVSSDMISSYEKAKLFTLFSPHPNGTILSDEKNDLFLIREGKKYPVSADYISKIKRNPVRVSKESLEKKVDCQFQKNIFSMRKYSCVIPLAELKSFLGKDYEFILTSNTDPKLETIEANFETSVTLENMKMAFGDMLTNIKRNYYGEPVE